MLDVIVYNFITKRMVGKSLDCTLSLTRFDDQNKSNNQATAKNIKSKSVFSKDNVVNSETVDIKRSKRLSQKRSFLGKSFTENKDQPKDVKRRKCETKNSRHDIVELEKSEVLRNRTEETSDRISTKHVPSRSDVRSLKSTADEANVANISVMSASTTRKSRSTSKCVGLKKNACSENNTNEDVVISDELEQNGNVVFKRKRGRPPLKKPHERNTDVIASSCADAGAGEQNTKGLTGIIEKLQDFRAPADSCEQFDNLAREPAESRNEMQTVDENANGETSSAVNVQTGFDRGKFGTAAGAAADGSDSLTAGETFDRPFRPGSLERALLPLSKRFSIPVETLGRMVTEESVPVFGEKYHKHVTPSMVTVSPIVVADVRPGAADGRTDVGYTIEPARESAAYGTDSLKDLMDELSRTMPSWCLSVVPDPRRYVISHVSIGLYGVPVADKSIVLDRYFRASVYVNQCLEYKYCKRYQSAPEIVDLIKELNSI